MPDRISDDQGTQNHAEAMTWVNQLIIDPKHQMLGELPWQRITMERLNEWHRHYRDLDQCRTASKVY